MNNEINDCDLWFKIILFLFIAFTLYIFISDDNFTLKILLLIILCFILFVDHSNNSHLKVSEQFGSSISREDRIKKLNDSSGKTGNFYVKCHPCGRKRILEDRKKACRKCYDRSYCSDPCTERKNETMSFFNNKYIDSNQISCYNCLMDDANNDRYFLKNYVYWPSIKDPVNGPPYV